jgi:hypothetical protein
MRNARRTFYHGAVLSLLTALSFGVGAGELSAHARFSAGKQLKPRDNNDGLKTGPCGGVAQLPENERVTLTAGESILVEWEETIEHPGWYRLAWSPDGETGYDDNIIADNISDTTGSVTRSDPTTWHRYSKTITVPDTECDKCSIQLIQVMNENPANPRNYYSCADVRIVKADSTAAKPAMPVIKSVTVTKSVKGG